MSHAEAKTPRTLSQYLRAKPDDTPPAVKQLQKQIEVAKRWLEELREEMREAAEIQALEQAIQTMGRNGARDVLCEHAVKNVYLRDLLNRFITVKTAELKRLQGDQS